jgi:hypothetical protein
VNVPGHRSVVVSDSKIVRPLRESLISVVGITPTLARNHDTTFDRNQFGAKRKVEVDTVDERGRRAMKGRTHYSRINARCIGERETHVFSKILFVGYSNWGDGVNSDKTKPRRVGGAVDASLKVL